MRSRLTILCVVALGLLLATGCTARKKWETGLSDVNSRVDSIQSTVEGHSEAIDQLRSKTQEVEQEVQQVDSRVSTVQQTSQQAMETATEARSMARGKVIWQATLTSNDVRFDVDGASITESGAAALDELIDRIKSYDKMVFIEIQGHTDSTGSEAYNTALGLKRAEAVRAYLHEHGIPLNLMSVISYGESRPIADNSTAEGRAANRRVEILILE